MKNKAIIFDRDGVINKDFGYVYKLNDLKFLPGVISALKKFQQLNYKLIIITNQSGIGRGYYTLAQMKRFNRRLLELLAQRKIKINKIYYCPHLPQAKCLCRKPKTALGKKAIKDFNIDVKKSYSVGDKDSDTLFSQRLGLKTILIENNQYQNKVKPQIIIKGFRELVNIIK